MRRTEKSAFVPYALEAGYSLLLLAWYTLPFVVRDEGLLAVPLVPFQLFGGPPLRIVPLLLTAAVVYSVPLICLFKLVALPLSRVIPAMADPGRPVPLLLTALSSAFALATMAIHALAFASSARYFLATSPFTYAVFLVSLGANACSLCFLVASLIPRKGEGRGSHAPARAAVGPLLPLSLPLPLPGITKRLLLTFVPMILAIIAALSAVLMRDFGATIMSSVFQRGQGLAERTASAIASSPTDMNAADDWLSAEADKNASSALPFMQISFCRRNAKSGALRVAACTDRSFVGVKVPVTVEPFTDAFHRYKPRSGLYEFIAPVRPSGKFIGYVSVSYAREAIYEAYFRTLVKVLMIGALSLYASTVVILASGRALATGAGSAPVWGSPDP